MKNVAVMFGGVSVEHEVSIISGLQIIENMDKDKYNPIPVYVSKDGTWYTGDELTSVKNYKDMESLIKELKKVYLTPVKGMKRLIIYPVKSGLFKKEKEYIDIDVVFPAFHGMHGEDGTMQGLFELADIPYVGSGVTGSALGMDKIVMKDVFKANGLPVVGYTWFLRNEYEKDRSAVIEKVEKSLKYPVFVKPANLGSSIGIGKAKNRDELIKAIEIAIRYDKRIIVEEGIEKPVEINCSAMGFNGDYSASVCEMPVSWEDFLSYDEKYMHSGNAKGMKGTARKVPAPIPDEKTEEIKRLSIETFKVLDCSGVARIDFLMEKETNKVYINEINTIPGSFAFYLWEPCGINFKELINKLIELAVKRHEENDKNIYTYDTALLLKASRGSKFGTK